MRTFNLKFFSELFQNKNNVHYACLVSFFVLVFDFSCHKQQSLFPCFFKLKKWKRRKQFSFNPFRCLRLTFNRCVVPNHLFVQMVAWVMAGCANTEGFIVSTNYIFIATHWQLSCIISFIIRHLLRLSVVPETF